MGKNRIIVLFDNYGKEEKVRPHSSLIHHCAESSKQRARDTKRNKPLQKNRNLTMLICKECAT